MIKKHSPHGKFWAGRSHEEPRPTYLFCKMKNGCISFRFQVIKIQKIMFKKYVLQRVLYNFVVKIFMQFYTMNYSRRIKLRVEIRAWCDKLDNWIYPVNNVLLKKIQMLYLWGKKKELAEDVKFIRIWIIVYLDAHIAILKNAV